MRYAALILILLAGAANAETFKCSPGLSYYKSNDIVVTATINDDGETGWIKVAGVTHQAAYKVHGFDRRWDFSLDEDYTYDYAFIIKADGTGLYYDFTIKGSGVKPSQFFTCERQKKKSVQFE